MWLFKASLALPFDVERRCGARTGGSGGVGRGPAGAAVWGEDRRIIDRCMIRIN